VMSVFGPLVESAHLKVWGTMMFVSRGKCVRASQTFIPATTSPPISNSIKHVTNRDTSNSATAQR
jgi:hypothetical protein